MDMSEVVSMLQEIGFDTDVNIDYATFERLILDDFVTGSGVSANSL